MHTRHSCPRSEYPEHQSTRGFAGKLQFAPGKEPEAAAKDLGWQGLQFLSRDKKNIAKFQVDLFSFSRLEPYETWESFSHEALRLWRIHADLSQPSEIERIGVRFINRFPLPEGEKTVQVSDYFKAHADDLPELNLQLAGFFHHETMTVPGHPYAINIIKTVQPAEVSGMETAFILDIDVMTLLETKMEEIEQRLTEFHWLKNKAFFGIITEKLTESLRE